MKKLFLASAILIFGAASASAADLSTRPFVKAPAPPPVPAAVANWTGFYVGGNVGYSWGKTDIGYVQDPSDADVSVFGVADAGAGLALNRTLRPESAIGGVQAGYDHQIGSVVLGVVADFGYRNGSAAVKTGALNEFGDFLTLSTKQEWLGTVRGRIGISPAPAWLVYATGGFAYGRVNHSVSQTFVSDNGSVTSTASAGLNKYGWTAGAGAEYQINRNWSLGVEYLYVDLGMDTLAFGPSTFIVGGDSVAVFPATRVSFRDTSNIARVTLNYRFGGRTGGERY